jgi:hypothetical protein
MHNKRGPLYLGLELVVPVLLGFSLSCVLGSLFTAYRVGGVTHNKHGPPYPGLEIAGLVLLKIFFFCVLGSLVTAYRVGGGGPRA